MVANSAQCEATVYLLCFQPIVRTHGDRGARYRVPVRKLVAQMTDEEKLRLLAGYQDLYKDLLAAAKEGHNPPLHSAAAVGRGMVPRARIDDAALRLVRQQLRFKTIGDDEYGADIVACEEHRELAREAAVRGAVLLRNETVPSQDDLRRPVLPLDPRRLGRLAVVGRFAATANTGDHGSSRVTAPYVVTPLQGLEAALLPLGVDVVHDDGSRPERAAAIAASADAAIVVVGYDYRDEGEYMGRLPPRELRKLLPRPPLRLIPKLLAATARVRLDGNGRRAGGDRRSLSLHDDDERLIALVAGVNDHTIVVLICGSAVLMETWRHLVPGILVLWYPGMEGGHALADLLLGRIKPTGRLPFAIPVSADHLPSFDPDAAVVDYGELHGQALLDSMGLEAAYPYGFGLTYDS